MRRKFKSSSGDPQKIRPGRNQGSDNLLETIRLKRVRFADPEVDDLPKNAHLVASRKQEATKSEKSDGPKTSEYAYFKKVRDNAGCSYSNATNRVDERLERFKSNDRSSGTSNASAPISPRNKDLRFTLPEGTNNHHMFPSPCYPDCNKLSQSRGKDIPNNVKPIDQHLFSSHTKGASVNSAFQGNQCTEKGIFSVRRQKLLQCVADASLCDIGKLDSKGFDLVSSLLSRLFPKGSDNDDSSTSKVDTDNNLKALTFWEPDDLEKRLQLAHNREWDKDILSNYLGISHDTVFPKWITSVSDYPLSNNDRETNFGRNLVNLDFGSESDINSSSYEQHNSLVCLPFERHGHAGSCHVEELDGSCYPIEYSRNEPHRLLLGWDPHRVEDKGDSSIDNQVISRNLCSRWDTSWNVDHRKAMDNIFDAKTLYPSSLCSKFYLDFHSQPNYYSTRRPNSWILDHHDDMDNLLDAEPLCSASLCSNYSREFDSLPNYYSATPKTRDFEPHMKNERALAETEWFPLALPRTLKYNEVVDCDTKDALRSSNILFSLQDPPLLTNKISFDKHLRDFELGLPSSSDVRWKCLPVKDSFAGHHLSVSHPWQSPLIDKSSYYFARTEEDSEETLTPFWEGAFNTHSGSSYFHFSLNKLSHRPLLLDGVSHDYLEQQIYPGDNELKYG